MSAIGFVCIGSDAEEPETVAVTGASALRTMGIVRAFGSTKPLPETCCSGAATVAGSNPLLNARACAGGCAKELETGTGRETGTKASLTCVVTVAFIRTLSEASLSDALGWVP
jgi:hypothetical protein